jgi:hypothetical protein
LGRACREVIRVRDLGKLLLLGKTSGPYVQQNGSGQCIIGYDQMSSLFSHRHKTAILEWRKRNLEERRAQYKRPRKGAESDTLGIARRVRTPA